MLLIFLCISQGLYAAGERIGRGSKPLALANAYTALADQPWCLYYNPSGIVQIGTCQLAFSYVPQQWELPELRTMTCAVAFPFSQMGCGLGIDCFGFELYREIELRTAVAYPMLEEVSIGLSLNCLHIQIKNYNTTTVYSVDMGCLSKVTDELSLGCTIRNLTSSTLYHGYEKLPQSFVVGVVYRFPIDCLIILESEKDFRYPMQMKVGVEQKLLNILSLRCGYSTEPDVYALGIGIHYAWCSIGYAGCKHLFLGWTHLFELSITP